jgi:hypothetical protein
MPRTLESILVPQQRSRRQSAVFRSDGVPAINKRFLVNRIRRLTRADRLDQLLIFGDPETQQNFLKRIAASQRSAAIR